MSLTRYIEETTWYGQLVPRLKAHWRFKVIAELSITTIFFIGYFLCRSYPIFRVREVPLTALDHLIGFQPFSLGLYASFYLYVALPLWLLKNKRDLIVCGVAMSVLCLLGLAFFLLMPTCTPDKNIDWSQYPSFAPLVAVDLPRNACPSLHVAFTLFSAIFIHGLALQLGNRRLIRALSWCWCVGILYSTLATKQHVAIDLYAGAALGAAWAWAYLRFFPLLAEKESPVHRSEMGIRSSLEFENATAD